MTNENMIKLAAHTLIYGKKVKDNSLWEQDVLYATKRDNERIIRVRNGKTFIVLEIDIYYNQPNDNCGPAANIHVRTNYPEIAGSGYVPFKNDASVAPLILIMRANYPEVYKYWKRTKHE